MIVADTGAMLALIDADDRHHEALRDVFLEDPDSWILPWAILPEVDYLLLTHIGAEAELAFVRDICDGRYAVDWGAAADLIRIRELCDRYRDLSIGIVDAAVVAIAERLRADAIATLDLRHFEGVPDPGRPAASSAGPLIPRPPTSVPDCWWEGCTSDDHSHAEEPCAVPRAGSS